MTPDHTRIELETELLDLTDRLSRIELRKANANTDGLQNAEEAAQYHEDDEVVEGLEILTRERIQTIKATLGGEIPKTPASGTTTPGEP